MKMQFLLLQNTGKKIPGLPINIYALVEKLWFRLGRFIANLYTHLMFKMDVVYKAPLPHGARILTSNHPSTVDPVMMTTLVREQVSILILETLFKIPLFGASLKLSGHIRVDYDNGKASLEEGLRYLKSGRTIGIFPEGIISPPDSSLHNFHTGAARLAACSGAPIIPVGIALDPDYIMRTNNKVDGEMAVGTWYLHGPYAITVGEALFFHGDPEDRAFVRSITERIQQQVAALSLESARRIRASSRRPVSTHIIENVRLVWSFMRGAVRTI
jgi:1-acyl-sn-glycerol-3-phosphate acyltransferase